MSDKNDQPTSSLFERCVTRREMLITTGGAMAGILLAGCGAGGEGAQEKGAPPVAGSFVGQIEGIAEDAVDGDAFVAIVATAAEEEEGGGEREVRAYLCSGEAINEWFVGSAEGNALDLTSEGGAQIEANLAPETATGTVTLDDGTSSTFTADLATGIAGLYNVTITPDLQVRGTSETGNRLEGEIADEPREDDLYPITGTIAVPDGPSQNIEAITASTEPAEARWVVLSDGQTKGGRKAERTGGFVLNDADF